MAVHADDVAGDAHVRCLVGVVHHDVQQVKPAGMRKSVVEVWGSEHTCRDGWRELVNLPC